MKKLFSILLALALLVLSACTPKTPETKYNIAGKTYYNASDISMSEERSRIWFGSDNSFVLLDNYGTQSDEITGTWKIDNNVIILSRKDNNQELRFEIRDEHRIIIKSSLNSCDFDTIFSDDEKYAKDSTSNNQSDSKEIVKTLYNASWFVSTKQDKPSVTLYADRTFVLSEKPENAKPVEISGMYGIAEDGTIMFSNFDSFKDMNGNDVHNFELLYADGKTYILRIDLIASYAGSQFNESGDFDHYLDFDQGIDNQFETTTWVHEPTEQSLPEYYPNFTIYDDLSFVFEENVYAGLAHYKGYCQKYDNGFGCGVTDASEMQGFAGQDVKYIEFKYDSDGKTLILQTDLCMSMSGDKFFKK